MQMYALSLAEKSDCDSEFLVCYCLIYRHLFGWMFREERIALFFILNLLVSWGKTLVISHQDKTFF